MSGTWCSLAIGTPDLSGQLLDPVDGDLPCFARWVEMLVVPAAGQLHILRCV
jgi:hypothetical protein